MKAMLSISARSKDDRTWFNERKDWHLGEHLLNTLPILEATLEAGVAADSPTKLSDTTTALWRRAGWHRSYGTGRGRDETEEFRVLLQAGANVNFADHETRKTVMMRAAVRRHEFIPLLLDAGARVNLRDSKGKSTLAYAARYPSAKPSTLQRLLDASAVETLAQSKDAGPYASSASDPGTGGIVDWADQDGNTPLMAAISAQNLEAALFLAEGANIHATNNDGHGALLSAVDRGMDEVMAMLLSRGVDIEHRDVRGRTPLMVAIEQWDHHQVKRLLRAGANADALYEASSVTKVPLIMAAAAGKELVVRDLIDHGADMQLVKKLKPDLARQCKIAGNDDLAQWLVKHGMNDREESA
ncbi:ankyrin repeat-containing domain protein [Microdochium trichocladiopsis]|uniref:Ankyrin repeat-containing domain protein n=1 Tax=Microdochium trichocladiopsis TaxID=1682393 RepID=A0A9P8Y9L6_9PEZI|nr:ankyrin repeat-containing domain protein [Microdochium trichocladiopsis]KAH7033709.1 ankyrin repeat-containing domain protein [Microdochium trichocladiopsis]